MAKEVITGDVVEVLEDEGPEEGEIEDDTSDEENVENYGLTSSNATQINTTIGAKYYQPPCTSSSEVHSLKPQAHSEEKADKCWGKTGRRRYKFYVDHDNPSREAYDRLKKSDLNSDHRELNFHELLSEYKTSKHGNEGNTHEKENRHYAKEVRLDSSRKRENGVNDVLADKAKRSKKRKHRHSPSRSPVSSDVDVSRRRKEIRTSRPRRRKKPSANIRNSKESAQIFAQIRASKLNLVSSEQKKDPVEVISVVSEGENQTEMSELPLNSSVAIHLKGEGNPLQKHTGSETDGKEGECLSREPVNYDTSKGLFTASDTQTVERIDDSESKDEDDDDVDQLRMDALRSAFRAKHLARKRLGLIKKDPNKTVSMVSADRSNVDFVLDDTAELLEAAEEESGTTCAKEPENNNVCTLLSEVPLPPDEPQNLPSSGITLVEDLTPVDMELALTDEEDNSEQRKGDECDGEFESLEGLHPKVRISRSLSKTRNIPVTIGRNQHYKGRQRPSTNDQENSRRSNLLEVRTSESEGMNLENLDSGCVSMEDLNMCSVVICDTRGTSYSTEPYHVLDEDRTLSETSDAKSDLIPAYSSQYPLSCNDNDDEDEELLRAKLLLDISSRHRKEEAMIKAALAVEELKTMKAAAEKSTTPFLVRTLSENAVLNSQIKMNGKSSGATPVAISQEKIKAKKNVERVCKGQLLQKSLAQKSAHAKQFPITTFLKGRTSKIANRGKYQRVNQSRMAVNKKRIDGNIQVTVPGSNTKSKVVSKIPQQQDRIVICLGEDSDDSDDEKQKGSNVASPQVENTVTVIKKASKVAYNQTNYDNTWEISCSEMTGPEPLPRLFDLHSQSASPVMVEQPKPDDSVPVGSVPVDFEKSVDLFLKEVRSVQEWKSKHIQMEGGTTSVKVDTASAQCIPKKPKVAVNTPMTQSGKLNFKSITGVTPQAVRHLPFPQQEEYRRLKMQISILERQKKLKAVEISQTLSKAENKEVPVSNLPALKLDLTTSKEATTERSGGNASNYNSNLNSEILLKDFKTQEKPPNEANNEGINTLTDVGIDDNEDENLMREQLLRSRIRKRAAAKAEVPSPQRDCSVLTAESNSETAVSSKQDGEESCHMEIIESHKSSDKVQCGIALDGGSEIVSSAENDMFSVAKEVLPGSEDSKGVQTHSKAKEIPFASKVVSSKAEIGTVEAGNAPLKDHVTNENKVSERMQVTNAKQDVAKKVIPVSETRMSEANTKTEKGTPSGTAVSRGLANATNLVSLQSPLLSNNENQESRELRLKELECQLLSERRAALKYLSELSQLLNAMESEGNRLREKETAVKKLKAELSLAEASLHSHKRLMKQLALNVSATHAHVTETRHRCTLLSRACLKLGNQIKQDEIANGGEKTIYKVPTGVAELVKGLLSRVLCRTKQLKKSGLPLFGLSQEFISKDNFSVKKPGKRFVAMHAQPHPMQWAKLSLASSMSNLKIEKNSMFTPSTFVKTVKNNISLVKKCAGNKPTAKDVVENVGSASTSISNMLPISKVTNAKSSASPKTSSDTLKSGVNVNQTATKEACVPDSLDKSVRVDSINVVGAGTLSTTEKDVTSWSRTVTSLSSFTLVPSDTNKKKLSEKGNQLKDYDSPLESISRASSEKLTADVSSGSQNVQPEDAILDPNIMLCPYDLMGVCQDEECTYQHQRRKGTVKKS